MPTRQELLSILLILGCAAAPRRAESADVGTLRSAYEQLQEHTDPAVRQRALIWNNLMRPRRWTDATGTHAIQARYLDHDAAVEFVRLETADGRTIAVQLSKLRPDDREVVRRIADLRPRIAADLHALGDAANVPPAAARPPLAPAERFQPRELRRIEFTCNLHGIAFSPDSATIAAAGNGITLCDVATGASHPLDIPGAGGTLCLAFSPDSKTLAVGGSYGGKLWDLPAGRLKAELNGHAAPVIDLEFSPTADVLASSSSDGTACLWDVTTGKRRSVLQGTGRVEAVKFSGDGRHLATVDQAGAHLVSTASGREVGKLTAKNGLHAVALDPRGKLLVLGTYSDVTTWDIATGRQIGTFSGRTTGACDNMAISPDGRWLATNGDARTVGQFFRIWDLATGKQLAELPGASIRDSPVAFSPDGRLLALGAEPRIITRMNLTIYSLFEEAEPAAP